MSARRPDLALTAALVLAIALGPTLALGQPSAEQAQRRIIEGQVLFKAERYAEALDRFREAANASPDAAGDARLQWNIARCYEEMSRFEDALEAFELARQLAAAPERRSRAERKIAAISAAHFGEVRIECPRRARVRIEGLAGERRCPVDRLQILAGQRRGTVNGATAEPIPFELEVRPGGRHVLDLLPEPVDRGLAPWGWAATGLGVAAIGGAIWARADGDAAIDEANRTDSAERYTALRDEHATSEVAYYSLLGVGAALLATGGTLLWLDATPDVSFGVGSAGVQAVLSW